MRKNLYHLRGRFVIYDSDEEMDFPTTACAKSRYDLFSKRVVFSCSHAFIAS